MGKLMRIRVALFTPSLRHAAINVIPSWWERLFGAREYDAIACADQGGWSWEQGPVHLTGLLALLREDALRLGDLARIDDLRILAAIERERAQCMVTQRTADLQRGVYP